MRYSRQNLAQLQNFLWLTKRGSQPNLIPTLKFLVAEKVWDSQPKLRPTPKFPVADKTQDSQPKLSPSLKFPVAHRVRDSQPKLSPTPKFQSINLESNNSLEKNYKLKNPNQVLWTIKLTNEGVFVYTYLDLFMFIWL